MIRPLSLAFVTLYLEYCAQFRSPYHKKDIDVLEQVQQRFTKVIRALEHMTYKERLTDEFGLRKRG